MSDPFPFDHSKLSPEDLEVLRAFHEMEDFAPKDTSTIRLPEALNPEASDEEEDMLLIFAGEADEDINTMREALRQMEQDDSADSPGLFALQRRAHKLRGAALAIGCDSMATIAHHIEAIAKQVKASHVPYMTGLMALVQGVHALELTLESVVEKEQESIAPLLDLEKDLEALGVPTKEEIPAAKSDEEQKPTSDEQPAETQDETIFPEKPFAAMHPFDKTRLDHLLLHTEQLVEQQAPLEDAQKQVAAALQELHAAQVRLRRLETLFSMLSYSGNNVFHSQDVQLERPLSSLVERILRDAARLKGRDYTPKERATAPMMPSAEDALWDEMEIDRYTETNLLAHSLSEAIADVSTATSKLQQAFARLETVTAQHMAKASLVRGDALALRNMPCRRLIERLQAAVTLLATHLKREVQFEFSGEEIELDQEMLDVLAEPLSQLVRENFAEGVQAASSKDDSSYRVWLHARTLGSEVTLEFGFSLPVAGGLVDVLHSALKYASLSISLQRNEESGITLFLRVPRSKGVVQGLLVRAGEQQLIIPFSQVRRIDYAGPGRYDTLYSLTRLLNFPEIRSSKDRPILLLERNADYEPQLAVQVDEVVGQIEIVMRPSPAYLRRPGIPGMAIDGKGNVLLVLSLPELIKQYVKRCQNAGEQPEALKPVVEEHRQPTVMIVDDSIFIREAISQTLSHHGYLVKKAHDGLEALERLWDEAPDAMLLDIEMPDMNGFDLLHVLSARPTRPDMKIIMLTSRFSDKHKERAFALGAHDYLTKPVIDEVLIGTLKRLLEPLGV